ncbi:DUF309 domain-containing protein [Bacillaceae bacterium W0354]
MYPTSYIQFLYHFHYSRDYFECHEVLEDYWIKHTNQERQSIWVGLIQLAVAFYHYRRDNLLGAYKLMKASSEKLMKMEIELDDLGLNSRAIQKQLNQQLYEVINQKPYKSIDLPIIDPVLKEEIKNYANSLNLYPNFRYNINDEQIIHRHLKKYRSISYEKK